MGASLEYFLYHSVAIQKCDDRKQNFTIKEISLFNNSRTYFSKTDYLWSLVTFGKFKKIVVLNDENTVVHTSCVIGKCFKFPFLPKKAAEIGPCYTHVDFRGRGIYPMVLNYVLSSGYYQEYYMLVAQNNTASIRGIEKAGFKRIGMVVKRRMRWVKC